MANLGLSFNPDEAEDVSFEDLPPGEYAAEIFGTDVKPTKAGTGNILAVQWRVTEGDFTNRRIFQNINYQNASAEAQRIGQGQLKQICKALDIPGHLEDSDVLHGGQALIVVGMGKAQNGYAARAEIKAVKPLAPQAPATVQTAARPAAPAQQRPAATAARPAPAAAKPAGQRPWGQKAAAAG